MNKTSGLSSDRIERAPLEKLFNGINVPLELVQYACTCVIHATVIKLIYFLTKSTNTDVKQ